jgi:hypothetical protein
MRINVGSTCIAIITCIVDDDEPRDIAESVYRPKEHSLKIMTSNDALVLVIHSILSPRGWSA